MCIYLHGRVHVPHASELPTLPPACSPAGLSVAAPRAALSAALHAALEDA